MARARRESFLLVTSTDSFHQTVVFSVGMDKTAIGSTLEKENNTFGVPKFSSEHKWMILSRSVLQQRENKKL